MAIRDQCDKVVEEECPVEEAAKKAYLLNDAKVQSMIIHGVSDKHLNIIKDCKSAKKQIQCLQSVFVQQSLFTKLTLSRKLFSLKKYPRTLGKSFCKIRHSNTRFGFEDT